MGEEFAGEIGRSKRTRKKGAKILLVTPTRGLPLNSTRTIWGFYMMSVPDEYFIPRLKDTTVSIRFDCAPV